MESIVKKYLYVFCLVVLATSDLFAVSVSELGRAGHQTRVRSESNVQRDRYAWASSSPDNNQRCFDRISGSEVPIEQAFLICPKLSEYSSKFIREYPLESNPLLHLTQGVVSSDVRQRFVENKKQEALNVLARAFNNPRASERAKWVYNILWNRLQREQILYPEPTHEYNYCTQNPNLYAFWDGRIRFCSRSLRNDEGYVLQSIIHEVAHATRVDRHLHEDIECGAVMAEMSAMADGGRSARPSGYHSRCRISPGFRIRD